MNEPVDHTTHQRFLSWLPSPSTPPPPNKSETLQYLALTTQPSPFFYRKANLLQYPALAPRASEWAADAAGLVQIIKAMPEGQDRDDLRQAYTDSLRIIWAVCCALSGVALLISLLTRSYSIDVELNTSHGVVEGRGGAGASSTEELVGDRAS